MQALALPELTTTAWARPFFTRSTQTLTGAAQAWLVVNMPATVAGASETMSARSRFLPLSEPLPVPRRLMSQKTPAARKPRGATMEPGIAVSLAFMLAVRIIERFGVRAYFRHWASAKFMNTVQSSGVIECLPSRT